MFTYPLFHALEAPPQLHQGHVDVVGFLLLRAGGLRPVTVEN